MDQMTSRLDPAKFRDPAITAKGETRATVALRALETLWFNTGTLCNLTCRNCYIESSPRNDRLAYLTVAEVEQYLDEIARDRLPTKLIGFTGGEPFLYPEFVVAVTRRAANTITSSMTTCWPDLRWWRGRRPAAIRNGLASGDEIQRPAHRFRQ